MPRLLERGGNAARAAIVARPMDTHAALRQIFGFERFRPGQAAAVAAALSDRDTLVVMPTGSGKSLCYQLPALMRNDLTLVVSPLVSLMQDQVQALGRLAGAKVELISSQRAAATNAQALERAVRGEVGILYVSPERFASPGFLAAVQRARVGLFVVDEAHCVSHWGHDFRPDYFALADAAHAVGARATIGLTATATPRVADDIVRRLALRDPVRVTTGFDRPNLTFRVVRCATTADKRRRLARALGEPDALPAIVYAGTRKASEETARFLQGVLGQEVLVYHAGLDRGVRALAQERFMAGDVPVMVATNAFGMGIDKANVRTVAHATVPGSLEAYYQEAGRAGRDGLAARGLLFAEQRDKGLHVFFIQRAQVSNGALERVSERLRWAGLDGRYDVPLAELAGLADGRGGDGDGARSIIGHLARSGLIAPEPSPPDRVIGRVVGSWDGATIARCRGSAHEAERVRWAQYRAVWQYVESGRCRRQALLAHFGDNSPTAPTGVCCDVCAPEAVEDHPPAPLPGGLDGAIVELVGSARPAVGRTRAVEILRGGRSKVIVEHAYDGLPAYGSFSHLRSAEVLERIDQLLEVGTLRSSGGRFPKLRAA